MLEKYSRSLVGRMDGRKEGEKEKEREIKIKTSTKNERIKKDTVYKPVSL